MRLIGALLCVGVVLGAREATAEEQSQSSRGDQTETEGARSRGYSVELGAQVGYLTPPIRGGTSPFGAGFGGHVGFDVSGFYVGAKVLDFLGGKDVDVSYRALLIGMELGYGFRFKAFGGTMFVLRPTAGFGDVTVSFTDPALAKADVVTSASGSSSSSDTISVNNVYVEPALTAMLASASHFVALNGSALVFPGISPYGSTDSTTWISYGLQGELGFRF